MIPGNRKTFNFNAIAVRVFVFVVVYAFARDVMSTPVDHSVDRQIASQPVPTATNTAASEAPPPPDPAQLAAVRDTADKAKIVVGSENREWYQDGDYDYAKGSIVNHSDRTVSYWSAIAYYLDSKGNILDSQVTNSGDTLLPGAAKRFEIMHTTVPKAKHIRVEVQEVVFQD